MKRRAKRLYLISIESFLAALDAYNCLAARTQTSVPLILLDHAVEMLLKAALLQFGHIIVHKGTNKAYSIGDCLGILRNPLSSWPGRAFADEPRVLLLHDQRNRVQHFGLVVSESMLAELMGRGCGFYSELHREAFGRDLASQVPERYSMICPATKASLVELRHQEIDFARAALRAGDKPSAENAVRNIILLEVVSDQDRTVDEKAQFVVKAEIGSNVDRRRLRGKIERDTMIRPLPIRKRDLVVLLDRFGEADIAQAMGREVRLIKGEVGIPVRVDKSDPDAIAVNFITSKAALTKVEDKWATQISNFNGQRAIGRPYFIDVHILLEFYLQRAHACFAGINKTETLALVISSMICRLPFWAWLSRLDETHIFELVRTIMEESRVAQVAQACARVLRFGKGNHLRARLDALTKDERPTVANAAEVALELFDKPFKERRALVLKEIPRVATAHAWRQITDRSPWFKDCVLSMKGAPIGFKDLLSLPQTEIDLLAKGLGKLDPLTCRHVLEFLSFVDDDRFLTIHAAGMAVADSQARSHARRGLVWFDEKTYCPFLVGKVSQEDIA
jgi:hypothetical protein